MSCKMKLTHTWSLLPLIQRYHTDFSLCSIAWDTVSSPWKESGWISVMQKGYGGVGNSLGRRTWVKQESGIYSAYCIVDINLSMERFLGQSPVCAPMWCSKIPKVDIMWTQFLKCKSFLIPTKIHFNIHLDYLWQIRCKLKAWVAKWT